MQAYGDEREALDIDVLDQLAELDDGASGVESDRSPALTDGFVHEVLVAVADMALRSKRRQADLDAALWSAGMTDGHDRRLAALTRLREEGCVDKVVELSDGGVLLSVTALGLDRLGNGIR